MKVSEAVALLKSKIGCPYVWGANGPDKFDCSGLRYWWSNATGNKRSDTTAAGFYDSSNPVPAGQYKVGDMAFLYSSGYVSHMSILIDADTVIEARGRAYGVVQTKLKDFLSRPGYKSRGVRRDPHFVLEDDPITPVVSHPSTVKYGSVGSTVRTLQSLLNQEGSRLIVDGVFGPLTRTAVRKFQEDKHLEVDGVVGPLTWAALGK